MEFAKSPQALPADAGCLPVQLDWRGLRARFQAARELRRGYDVNRGDQPAWNGSFHRSAAAAVARLVTAQQGINPTPLGNVKAAPPNDGASAGTGISGERGLR